MVELRAPEKAGEIRTVMVLGSSAGMVAGWPSGKSVVTPAATVRMSSRTAARFSSAVGRMSVGEGSNPPENWSAGRSSKAQEKAFSEAQTQSVLEPPVG